MKPTDLSTELEHFKGLWVALTATDTVVSSNKSAQEAYKEAIKKGYKEPILFKVPKHDLPTFI
jgi:Family of unknown function (DUF5678)